MNRVDQQWLWLVILGAILVAIAFANLPEPTLTKSSIQTEKTTGTLNTESVRQKPALVPRFEERANEAGLIFYHMQLTDHLAAITETLGAGGCVLDYNNDGLLDVFLVGGTGHTRFYGKESWWHSPQGHGLFKNITAQKNQLRFTRVAAEESGIDHQSWGMGCSAGDLDNDGFEDLLVTNHGKNLLLRNNGQGRFIDVTDRANLVESSWSTSAAMADVDGDGLLDIYVANYIDFYKGAVTFESARGFQTQVPVAFQASLYNALPNHFYHNQGDFTFVERAQEFGIDNSAGRSLSIAWFDADNDRDSDLLVVNDRGSPSRLFLNQGNSFTESNNSVSVMAAVESAAGNHAVFVADIDTSGAADLLMTSPVAQAPKVLLHSDSAMQYIDRSWDVGLALDAALGLSGWGGTSGDFNNDGRLDVLVNHGMLIPDPDSDAISLGQGMRLWLNEGKGPFELPGFSYHQPLGHYYGALFSGRAVLSADFDNDGDLDAVLLQNNGPVQLLQNYTDLDNSTANWLGVQLIDEHGNTSGLGAKVTLTIGEKQWYRFSASQYGFLSRNSRRFHFAVDSVKSDSDQSRPTGTLTIQWPNGEKQKITNVTLNQYVSVRQNENRLLAQETMLNDHRKVDSGADDKVPGQVPEEWLQHKADYFAWLLRAKPSTETVQLIEDYIDSIEKNDRIAIYGRLLQLDHPALVVIAKKGLGNENDGIKVAALQWLQRAELEQSIHWIIDKISLDSTSVSCAVAEAFEHFFREEEAVIQRKVLSLPPLLQQLEASSPEKTRCVLRALAESEHYRALQPVIRMLDHPLASIRKEAIRTLGWLRHRRAEEPLQALLFAAESGSEIQAAALIALARINRELALHSIQRMHASDGTDSDTLRVLKESAAVITALVRNPEGLVIREELTNAFFSTVQLFDPISNMSAKQPELPQLQWLFELAHSFIDPQMISIIEPFLKADSENVRIAAYSAMASQGTIAAVELMNSGLWDPSALVRAKVVQLFNENDFRLSPVAFNRLLALNELQLLHSADFLALLNTRHGGQALDLVNQVIAAEPRGSAQQVAALRACQKFPGKNIQVPDLPIENLESEVLVELIGCRLAQHKSADVASRKQLVTNIEQALTLLQEPAWIHLMNVVGVNAKSWHQSILLKLLNDNRVSGSSAVALLEAAALSQPDSGVFLLMAGLNHHEEYVQKRAVVLLKNLKVSDALAKRQLREKLADRTASFNVRLDIAEMLYADEPDLVVNALGF